MKNSQIWISFLTLKNVKTEASLFCLKNIEQYGLDGCISLAYDELKENAGNIAVKSIVVVSNGKKVITEVEKIFPSKMIPSFNK